MDVMPGNKQTEVGVIPEDWQIRPLGELASVSAGGTPSRSNADYWAGDIPWVTTSEIDFYTITQTEQHITEDGLRNSAAKLLQPGTLLMALYGQGKTRGKVGVLGIRAATNQACAGIALNGKVLPSFIFHFLASQYGNIRKLSNTGNQENLSGALVRSIPIVCPLPEEQSAIASALSDVDGLLAALDRLIAKKRDLKQAAMQQLLTGQTRLPGFKGEWDVKAFGEMAALRRDRIDPKRTGGHDFCIELEHIESSSGELSGSTSTGAQASLKSVFHSGDVLFGKLRAYLRKYWLADRSGVCSTEIWVLTPRDCTVTTGYLFQIIKTEEFIEAASNAYGTHMPRSDWNVVKNHEIALPSLVEQAAIAKILSDMDAELAALEARRDKTRAIKQGMMQELLTGRTRLVEPQVSESKDAVASQSTKGHNWAFNEAVVIATLVKHFGKDDFPLGRKRYTKLSYLFHRHAEREAEGYLKKAAGPYNPQTKYGGPEKIAQQNGYIKPHKGPRGHSGFIVADSVAKAEDYFEKWYGSDVVRWLEQFRYNKNDDLEVLATVDMAVQDLRSNGKRVDVAAVKDVIDSHPEWKAKLDRDCFADDKIGAAIEKSETLFGADISEESHA